jgi:ribosomal protein S18 acetylase RimI-like enzyme
MSDLIYIEQAPTLDAYNALRRDAGWPEYGDLAQLRAGLDGSLYHIHVLDDGETIGMGRVIGDGHITFYIQDIIVAKTHQGRGIGREIMRRIMGYIDEHAAPGAVIGLMAAKGKEGFYERFGFWGRPNETMGKGMMQFGKGKPQAAEGRDA